MKCGGICEKNLFDAHLEMVPVVFHNNTKAPPVQCVSLPLESGHADPSEDFTKAWSHPFVAVLLSVRHEDPAWRIW